MNLRSISPAQLKKYGMYAVLSLSLSLNTFLILDNRRSANEDIRYERSKNDELQRILIQQATLQKEQEELLNKENQNIVAADSAEKMSATLVNKTHKLKKRR